MAKIGVFDSGFGGLTVAREVRRQLPAVGLEFYGDNARAPYGGLSATTIVRYSREIADFLADRGVDALIIGCNTATAAAFDELKARYRFPVLGVIEPGVRAALSTTVNNKIGVIATEFTIHSGAHKTKIEEARPAARVFDKACPRLAPLVEAGTLEGPEVEEAMSSYLVAFDGTGIDTLLLACTHYPVLMKAIIRRIGPDVVIVDPAVQTVREITELLGLDRPGLPVRPPTDNFYTSGDPDLFARIGASIYGYPIDQVRKIALA